jgi:NitT/TauT family transport system substrate-binding protein
MALKIRMLNGRKIMMIAGATIGAGVVFIGGHQWNVRSRSGPAGVLEPVTIATTAYAGTCPVLAAESNGYYEGEGLRATIQPHTTGRAALDAVMAGQADFGTSADLPIMFAAMKHQPVLVVATMFVTDSDYGIVGRRDRGIAAPASLKGKRVGVTLSTSGHFVLDAFLNRQRLSTNDVEKRDYKPEALAAALASGDVDAVSAWDPYLSAMREQLGANGVLFSAAGIYDSVYAISGRRDYVMNRPETVQRMMRALIRGAKFCKEVPDRAGAIVANITKTDVAKLRQLWPSFRFNVRLDQSLLLALEDETRWAIRNQLVEGREVPNYLEYFYLDGMQVVAPAALTVIH